MEAGAQLVASSLPWIPAYLGLSDTRGQHQEADQEPCQVYQCLLENGRGFGHRAPSRPD